VKIGERLKKFRTAKNLSQKQLAVMSKMSEPAIRNYELGNRYPNGKQLEKIAGALGISPLAIADPDFDSYHGLMHSLFQLEDLYGLKPQIIGGKIMLSLDVKPTSSISQY
jgi:transcriptional regulator with XRE-family HTH domain